ncbi:unnamed protein product [Amaranthus hypochondriacus]
MPRHSQIPGFERREKNEAEAGRKQIEKEQKDGRQIRDRQSRPKTNRKPSTSSSAQKIRMPNASPFSPDIVNVPVDRMKLPSHVRYEGKTDPTDHLNAYQGHMSLGAHSDASWCKNFALTMTGLAQTWFQCLPEGSVANFDDLVAQFMSQYAPFIRRPKQSVEMMKCRQKREESLNDYIARFSTECLTISKPEDSIILLAFRSGLNDDRLESLRFKEDEGWINIHDMDDVRERAERFTASEIFKHIAAGLRGERQEKKNHSNRDRYPDRPHDGQDRRKNKSPAEERGPREDPKRPTLRTFARFTPLNTIRARIFELHQNSKLWERPTPTRKSGNNLTQFCDFHGALGHSTKNCRTLKNNLEDLIQRGYFKNFIKWDNEQKNKTGAERKRHPGPKRIEEEPKRQKKSPVFVIFKKSGGLTDEEAHLRAVVQPTARVFEVHKGAEAPYCPDMTFTKEDCKGVIFPHSDPLVMVVDIAEQPVYRVLIDTETDVNVIYKSCWDKMDVGDQRLLKATAPIVGQSPFLSPCRTAMA